MHRHSACRATAPSTALSDRWRALTPAERALAAIEQLLLNLDSGEQTYGQVVGGIRLAVAAWRREGA